MSAIAAWAALMLLVQPPIILLEESHKVDRSMFLTLLGHVYILFDTILDPTQFGYPQRRPRFYGVMVHRHKHLSVKHSLVSTMDAFQRKVAAGVDFKIFLVATDDELDGELAWAASRRKSRSRGKSVEDLRATPSNPFELALIPMELERKVNCESVHPGESWMLNQNADRGNHSRAGALHTLLHNAALHWVSGIAHTRTGCGHLARVQPTDRWIAASEHALAMGFPVLKHLVVPSDEAYWRRTGCYSSISEIMHIPRQQVVADLGNSVHTSCCYAVLVWALSCIETTSDSPLLALRL